MSMERDMAGLLIIAAIIGLLLLILFVRGSKTQERISNKVIREHYENI